MPRKRWMVALAVLIALLLAVEVAVRQWQQPRACVQIINQGQDTMEDLVVLQHETRMAVGRVPSGQSVQVWMTAGPPGPLRLEFRQKSNALSGFQIAEYDPLQNAKDGFKLVLVVANNQIQRYFEDDDAHKDPRSTWEKFIDWFQSELEPSG